MRKWTDLEMKCIKESWFFDGDTLRWARNANGGKKIGDPVGITTRKSGHENVYLTINSKLVGYVLARIVWFFLYDEQPTLEVEHSDCNPKNNRKENLRLSTRSQNMANTKVGRTGRTEKGTFIDKRNGKWHFQVCKEGKVYGGYGYASHEEAYAARMEKAVELFGEFAR